MLMQEESSRQQHHHFMKESEPNDLESCNDSSSLLSNDYSISTASRGNGVSDSLHSAMEERLRWLQEYNRSVQDALEIKEQRRHGPEHNR